MKWDLYRAKSEAGATIGQLFVDGVPFCDVLEDEVREVAGQPVEKWKQFGVTAIPSGVYEISFEKSNRFGPQTLTVNNVPGFQGIRIHGGNTSADTEGCLLPGIKSAVNKVSASQHWLSELKDAAFAARFRGESVTLRIHNAMELANGT